MQFVKRSALGSFGVLSAALLALSAGCANEPSEDKLGQTGLALSTDLTGESDVASIRFEVTPVDCSTGEATGDVVVTDRPLEPVTIPGGISGLEDQPLDANSEHVFADLFSSVPAGCYDVAATPLNDAGEPSEVCYSANKKNIEVVEGETTEVLLINQCKGEDPGGIDVIAALNTEPDLSTAFEESKFVCQRAPQVICATSIDPDDDPVEFEWTVSGDVSGPVVVSHEHDHETGAHIECVQFRASEPGRYDVEVKAYDMAWRDGEEIRIEDWLELEGYPSESHSQQSLFFYATECAGSLEPVGVADMGWPYGYIYDISDDGSTAAGYSGGSAGAEAMRWQGTYEGLGVPLDFHYTYGMGVSGDGSVVAGYGSDHVSTYALLWSGGSWTNLGTLPGGTYSVGYDVNAAGTIVVGYANDSTTTRPSPLTP